MLEKLEIKNKSMYNLTYIILIFYCYTQKQFQTKMIYEEGWGCN